MAYVPPDMTIGTRASAKVNDVHRMQSVHQQSPEERMIRERAESRSTVNMAIAGFTAVAVFLVIWWLVVH